MSDTLIDTSVPEGYVPTTPSEPPTTPTEPTPPPPALPAAVLNYTPPQFPDFTNPILKQEYIKVDKYSRHISLRKSMLFSSTSDKHGLRSVPPALPLFTPFLDKIQKGVVEKCNKQWQRNSVISRTMHQQLLACLKQAERKINISTELIGTAEQPFPSPDFPEEKWRRLQDVLAEAVALDAMMEAEAEALRKQNSEGNLKWVDKL